MSNNYTRFLMGSGLPDPLVIPRKNPQPREIAIVVINLKGVGER
jgi:hypothetical protein